MTDLTYRCMHCGTVHQWLDTCPCIVRVGREIRNKAIAARKLHGPTPAQAGEQGRD